MVFSSIPFLYFFLPVCLLLYYLIPAGPKGIPFRNGLLLIFSLIFYAFGEPVYILLLIVVTLCDYVSGLLMHYVAKKPWQKKCFLILSLCITLSILGYFKYTDFAISTVNALFKKSFSLRGIALPIGISFFTFQSMSYSIDMYRGIVQVEKNYFNYLMYVSLFPQLIAGPIVRFSTVQEEIHSRTVRFSDFKEGFQRFLVGLFRKVLLANQMGRCFDAILAVPVSQRTVLLTWLGSISFMLQLYFDFSAYSDMAIGLGRMLGFHFPENFNYPYLSLSIEDFWRRWHMSLSTWFRDYVFYPLLRSSFCTKIRQHLKNKKKKKAMNMIPTIFSLMINWSLIGLWHGAFWNYILWGLYNGVILCLEQFVYGKKLEKAPKAVRRIYSLFIICTGLTLFAIEDFSVLGGFMQNLFGIAGAGFCNTYVLWILRNYGVIMLISILLSMGFYPWLKARIEKSKEGVQTVCCLLGNVGKIVLFVLCTAYLIGDTYNPFLYFRF